MTINLPDDLGRFIRAEVHRGRFVSEEDAVVEAVRLLRGQLSQRTTLAPSLDMTVADPVLGTMRNAIPEMNEVVADAMKEREHRPLRLSTQ